MALEEDEWYDESSVHKAPYVVVPDPEHDPIGPWQESFYDPGSGAPIWGFRKLPGGPCSFDTGRVTTGDFPSTGLWKQV